MSSSLSSLDGVTQQRLQSYLSCLDGSMESVGVVAQSAPRGTDVKPNQSSGTAAVSGPVDGEDSCSSTVLFFSGNLSAQSGLLTQYCSLLKPRFNKNLNSLAQLSTDGYVEITANILVYLNSLNMSLQSSETV